MPSQQAYAAYVPDTTTGEDEQAVAQVAHQIAKADFVTATGAAYQVEKKRLYRQHCDTLKSADEWRMSIQHMNERDRQRVQRGKIMAAIEEVQGDATALRRAEQESTEDLLNDTVIKNWMPWLFDAMVGPDADPDVKRMALEAGDKANINQIY